jgi:multimeric flavodoxin WrbA
VAQIDDLGYDQHLMEFLRTDGLELEGSLGGLIVRSESELYTKSFAQNFIFHCNKRGMAFIGHSVIEITKDYLNFETWQRTMPGSLEEICMHLCKDLFDRIKIFTRPNGDKILALHSSAYTTSNTLGLWHLVKENLIKRGIKSDELHIENGTVVDCKGCTFQTCVHFGKNRNCFFGGVMVKEVLPAIEASDIIVWICPNYNDSISSNLLAVINRLTVLYRQISFSNKAFYAVIVSGNSGSDALAKQLIGALNINKGFFLPPKFSVMAVANAPMKVLKLEGIDKKANEMAKNIIRNISLKNLNTHNKHQ